MAFRRGPHLAGSTWVVLPWQFLCCCLAYIFLRRVTKTATSGHLDESGPLRRHQSRRGREEQLDDGIDDTFVSVSRHALMSELKSIRRCCRYYRPIARPALL